MEANEVDAEFAKASGDAGGVLFLGEVRAEGHIDAEEANAQVIFGVGLEIGSNSVEVAGMGDDAVFRLERLIQRAEVGRAGEGILVNLEGEILLGEGE